MSSSTLKIETPRAFIPLLGSQRFKGISGGRGSGKSHFVAEALIEEAATGHVRVACLRETQISIKDSVKQLLEDKIRALSVEGLFEITEREIRGPNDSLFIFRGLQNHTAASIKSLEGFNRAWVEEAQTISQKSLDIATPTFRRPGTQMLFTWNPNLPTDPVDVFFRENEGDPDIVHIKVDYRNNPWFPEELERDMERDKRRDPDKYSHIWLGEYQRNSEARVFRNWQIGILEVPSGARSYYGADWGFAIDPTVLVKVYLMPNSRTLYIEREVYKVGCDIDHTPALFDRIDGGEARKWPIVSDSARPETISYMRKNGYPRIRGALKGAGSVEDGIEFMRSHDIVVHPDCRHTIDELTLYSYKTDPLTGEVLPVLEDKHNHVIDACRYAVEAMRRATSQTVFGSY